MVSRTRLQWLALGAGGALACAALCWQHREARRQAAARPGGESLQEPLRQLDRGAGVLALAVAADSTLEHCRGDFRNRAMYAPLLSSGLSLLAGSRRLREALPQAHRLRDAIALGSVLTGLAGTGFHLWNVARRPGGIGWSNLFYAAPLGAPAALVLSGLLGGCAERLRRTTGDGPPRAFGLPAGRALALMSAAGLLGTSAEAGLLHFRGAFQNPAMFLPVSAPPIAAGLLAGSALAGAGRPRLHRLARYWLRFTVLMGLAGAGFHAFGVARNHGGWRNWRQNLHAGPPLPAPAGFTGLALAGLAAERLLDRERQALAHHGRKQA
ncbi:hypothetical protein [Azotobacter salinestris]|uniref:hypothetical protein n=1 Tax=Azotobacter salinestris TaxID=69964 RepID=UPI0032DEE8CF